LWIVGGEEDFWSPTVQYQLGSYPEVIRHGRVV
jgi:hypothetical protein